MEQPMQNVTSLPLSYRKKVKSSVEGHLACKTAAKPLVGKINRQQANPCLAGENWPL